jgi:hypothetical protein
VKTKKRKSGIPTGNAGEYFVMGEILRRGFDAQLADRNTKGYDMKAADLNRFLVVCALVSDLYCPGYNPSQRLPRDSSLTLTTLRYKVNTATIATRVREELLKGKHSRKSRVNAKNRGIAGRKVPH